MIEDKRTDALRDAELDALAFGDAPAAPEPDDAAFAASGFTTDDVAAATPVRVPVVRERVEGTTADTTPRDLWPVARLTAAGLYECVANGELLDLETGAITAAATATDSGLVAWFRMAEQLVALARMAKDSASTELARRSEDLGGDVRTPYGTGKSTTTTAKLTAAQARELRDVLERLASEGRIAPVVADNLTPLDVKAMPAKVRDWIAGPLERSTAIPDDVKDTLRGFTPRTSRVFRVDLDDRSAE